MTRKSTNVRLFVDAALGAAQSVVLSRGQAHYLFSVMRLEPGDSIAVFNGRDGEWRAEIMEAGKKGGTLDVTHQSAPQTEPPDLWLLFAPIKKARTDFIVEKATELGARRIMPVRTRYTNAERVRTERLRAHAVEAAEQCGGTFVPEIAPVANLGELLGDWPDDRRILFCDENEAGKGQRPPTDAGTGGWAILIGPEGGFAPEERATLQGLPMVSTISLGPRILRADTAAVAALALWQAEFGDWR